MSEPTNRHRILVIDDNEDIHADIRSILTSHEGEEDDVELSELERKLFGESRKRNNTERFEVESAKQGKEGFELVQSARTENDPFCVAFVDVRMPPGWDGIETIGHIRRVDSDVQIIICTAYSDYSADQLIEKFESSDNLFVLKKPFEKVEIYQMASALAKKWSLHRQLEGRMSDLESLVKERTQTLEITNEELRRRLQERESIRAERSLDRSLKTIGQLTTEMMNEIESSVERMSETVSRMYAQSELSQPDSTSDQEALKTDQTESRCQIESCEPFLRQISSEINQLESIIAASKEIGSAQQKRRSPTDVHAMLENVITLTRLRTSGSAELVVQGDLLPALECEVGQLYQVLVNVLSHVSQKVREHHDITKEVKKITITTQNLSDQVCIRIENQAEDIRPEIRDIYEQMLQGDEVGKYAGQGLALARSIVIDLGGQMEFKANESGSKIIMSLPVR